MLVVVASQNFSTKIRCLANFQIYIAIGVEPSVDVGRLAIFVMLAT